jgi:[phosphatase 2A protein]-leucine-carboxy methyltransferase
MFQPPTTKNADPDGPTRATDNDAAVARLSAVRKGYLADPYIAPLIPRAHLQQPRPPLINIGTYLRTRAIDLLLDDWFRLTGRHKVQIISLGAGSDTRFWRLAVRLSFSHFFFFLVVRIITGGFFCSFFLWQVEWSTCCKVAAVH